MHILKRAAIGLLAAVVVVNAMGFAVVHAIAPATISISLTSGPPGTSVTVSSSNFTANDTDITVTYDGVAVSSGITANATGGWNRTFGIPLSASGTHLIIAQSAISSGNLTFTVTPVISLNRTSGPTGTSVTVNGAGFAANETSIIVTYGSAQMPPAVTANPQGTWSATFTVPASSGGAHVVDASGASTTASSVPDVAFNVTAGITVNRTSGAVGTPVTVSGVGFGASESGITVTYDGAPVIPVFAAGPQGTWSKTFNVPASQAGSHNIDAFGSVTLAGTVQTVTFSITPSITLSKAGGSAGTSVTVTGSSFDAGETGISVTYDGAAVSSSISANPQGGWTATFVVPPSAAGLHTIDASGSVTQAVTVADVKFAVTPGIAVNKTTGPGGTSVTVTGTGFAAAEVGISVTYDGAAVASAISANTQGGWTSTFAVPVSAGGPHVIDASSSTTPASSVPDASFDIAPGIAVNKPSGNAGGSVTVTGSGFGGGETGISVTYDGQKVASDISANARGGWTATFVVPPSASGSHAINASGPITQSTVSEAGFAIGAGVSVDPTQGHVGSTVEVSGSGFAVNTSLKITYDGADALSTKLNADASGSFSQTVTIPRSQAGAHTIKVTDGEGHSAQTTFNISSNAPPAPTLLSPADGGRVGFMGSSTPTLEWSAVDDPSGVTYRVQVDTFSDFSSPRVDKKGILGTHYTLSSAESLPQGNYFWRVRATNGASVDGDWSQTRQVKSGLISPAILGMILLLIVAAGIGVWFAVLRPKAARQAAVPAPQAPQPQVVQGEWRAVESEDDGGVRRLPWRLALPEAPKGARAVSTEDQARLKVVLDFAKSLPLVEPGHDVDWLVDLAHSNAPDEPRALVAEQLLKGEAQIRYEPAWMNHPIYQDLQSVLEGQSIMQDLDTFVSSVGASASEAVVLLQDIYNNAAPEAGPDFFGIGGWSYVAAVYSDAMNWFLGRSLKEPGERDYTVSTDGAGTPGVYLSGAETTPFAGRLIQAADEAQAARLRSLHVKLRRTYRNDERARRLASMITQVEVQRNRLSDAFSQLGRIGQ